MAENQRTEKTTRKTNTNDNQSRKSVSEMSAFSLFTRDVSDVALADDSHLGRGAECCSERDAVEVLAHVTAADWRHVEGKEQHDEDDDA